MKITAKRKRIDDHLKYKIGDQIVHNVDLCRIIGYGKTHLSMFYCIEVPSGGHTGSGSINEYGDPTDLSKFKCWFVQVDYYQ